MQMQIFAMTFLLIGFFFLGCVEPTMGQPTPSPSASEKSDRDKTDKTIPEEKESKKEPLQKQDQNTKKPAGEKKMASLKISAKKYRFRWSDDKLSDFPLIIELPEVAVPNEIQGPFPADAEWRTKEPDTEKNSEKKSEKKSDEKPGKKPEKSIWPWS